MLNKDYHRKLHLKKYYNRIQQERMISKIISISDIPTAETTIYELCNIGSYSALNSIRILMR